MVVKLSALRADHPLAPENSIVRLEGIDQLKNPMSSSGMESTAFRLVA
jgi:hypothetical protein